LTFTQPRSGNKNDGVHVEQKNWHIVRQAAGYHRYDTGGELELLNQTWAVQQLLTHHFGPQQKLLSKTRNGAKMTKPTTPQEAIPARPRRFGNGPQTCRNQTHPLDRAVEPRLDSATDPSAHLEATHSDDQQERTGSQAILARTFK
jgi:hypothetical protein